MNQIHHSFNEICTNKSFTFANVDIFRPLLIPFSSISDDDKTLFTHFMVAVQYKRGTKFLKTNDLLT